VLFEDTKNFPSEKNFKDAARNTASREALLAMASINLAKTSETLETKNVKAHDGYSILCYHSQCKD
jgi:hypothetical protein